VAGSGTIALGSALFSFGGGLVLGGAVGAGQTVRFGGPNQKLTLQVPDRFAGTLAGFTSADTIALPGSITAASFASGGTGGVLSLFASEAPAGSLAFAGDFTGVGFNLSFDDGEAILSTDAPCFAAGTRIATPAGPVSVEVLKPGDQVLTPWNEALPVRWLGHRRIVCERHPRPHDVLPVRILAGAFAPGVPARDLRLSPDHAVFYDGALVPVRYLLNGATIVQEQVERVVYWHVELERHDVLLAEGLACESYLDTGNRSAFANGGTAAALHPEFGPSAWAMRACGRLVTDGPALAMLRSRLFARALVLGFRLLRKPMLLLANAGWEAAPRRRGDWNLFRLPPGMRTARLHSRTMAPGELRPGDTDHRRLGIPVVALRIDGAELALDDPRLGTGWHPPELGMRWTGGAAEVDLTGVRRLALQAPSLLEYWEAPVSPAVLSGSRRLRP
jgi:hypothetical protein